MIYKPYGLCYWKQKSKPVDAKNVLQIISQQLNDHEWCTRHFFYSCKQMNSWFCRGSPASTPGRWKLLVCSRLAEKSNKTGPKAEECTIKIPTYTKGRQKYYIWKCLLKWTVTHLESPLVSLGNFLTFSCKTQAGKTK